MVQLNVPGVVIGLPSIERTPVDFGFELMVTRTVDRGSVVHDCVEVVVVDCVVVMFV